MKAGLSIIGTALVFFSLTIAYTPASHADRGRSSGRALRLPPSSRHSGAFNRSSRGSLDALQGIGRMFEPGRQGYTRRDSGRSFGNVLDYGRGDYGRGLSGLGDWYGQQRYHDRYDSDREYARAMRDAAIAGAVVNVVGIIAGTAANSSYRAYPQAYAPPVRRYATERTLVRPGGYEQYQVWVPDRYDTRTGETIMGHYETRQRYVPELYEERPVVVGP